MKEEIFNRDQFIYSYVVERKLDIDLNFQTVFYTFNKHSDKFNSLSMLLHDRC
jgi:hypothetical protein